VAEVLGPAPELVTIVQERYGQAVRRSKAVATA
jgi:hypothetical protein